MSELHSVDVAIIGGGVIGTAIARELSKYQLKVALLEKEPDLSTGTTKANSEFFMPDLMLQPVLRRRFSMYREISFFMSWKIS